MKKIVEYLKLDKPSDSAQVILRDAMDHLRDATKIHMRGLKEDYNYAGADWEKVISVLPSYAQLFDSKHKWMRDDSSHDSTEHITNTKSTGGTDNHPNDAHVCHISIYNIYIYTSIHICI